MKTVDAFGPVKQMNGAEESLSIPRPRKTSSSFQTEPVSKFKNVGYGFSRL